MEKSSGPVWIRKRGCGGGQETSWEELAFAEDDASGSMWPPRSYTCSFCRREFRSAQALGGHMNVHRRDRARLKQAEDEDTNNNNNNIHQYVFSSSSPSLDHDIREESCYTLVFNPNPDSYHESQRSCVIDLAASSPYLTSSRVSALPRKEGSSSSSLSFVLEHSKSPKKIRSTSPVSLRDQKRCHLSDSAIMEREKKRKIERDAKRSGCRAKLDLVNNNDISVSLSLVIHRSLPVASHGDDDDEREERDWSCKRRRIHGSSSQPSITSSNLSCKNDVNISWNEEIKHRANAVEDLDLELRLGADPPKVN